jgi:hypothetical protein
MDNKLKITLMAIVMAMAVAVPSAEASSISFDDGVHPIWIVADNSPDDLNALAGWITVSGGYADTFLFFAETGITKPILGSAEAPIMFVDVSATSASANQTLIVTFSETDFGLSSLDAVTGATVNMDEEGSVGYLVLQDAGNALFTGPAVGGGFVAGPAVDQPILDNFLLLTGDHPYSLTQAFVIHHASANLQTTDIEAAVSVQPVPDGSSSLALLSLGMIGLGAVRRKLSL